MNLLKLLLVDDEKIILKGLEQTYDWQTMGYQVVGTASSGEEALALLEDEEPDVVITDVRMKKISGLDLIERAKTIYPEMKFVVVSAYKDFEYAKKACEEGALAYLVKPIDEDELQQVMKKAHDQCIKERQKKESLDSYRKILVEDQGGFLGQMILRYVQSMITEQELLVLVESLAKEITIQNHFAAICIDIDTVYKVTNQVEYDAKRYLLFTEIEESIRKQYDLWEYTNNDGSHTYLVNLKKQGDTELIKEIIERIKTEGQYEIVSGISKGYAGLGGLKTAYKQSLRLYEIACEAGARILVVSKDADVPVNSRYFEDVEHQLLRVIRKNSSQQLADVFEKVVYNLPSQEEVAKTYLHRLAVQVEVMLDDSYELSENIKMGFSNFYGMIPEYTLLRLIDILYKLLKTIIEERLTLAPALTEEYFEDYMERALDYIREHIKEEELSITVVADHVYLNPVYFGRLFKNVMGMTFKKYVLNERMERAKKNILETGESIAVVAEEVGIPNPSYFSQLFKQATGMLPSEYKKEYS